MWVSSGFKAFQQSCHIKSRQENTGFCIKNNIVAKLIAKQKKTKKNYKNTYETIAWKQDSKKSPRRTDCPSILDPKTMKNEAGSIKNTCLEKYI